MPVTVIVAGYCFTAISLPVYAVVRPDVRTRKTQICGKSSDSNRMGTKSASVAIFVS